ncbi:bone morphogenetic protein 4-like [Tubulanus polymorphus]|uniref:bone morphogenetic protein 4-like n=1 Tax=Tubulanus polymorphus TaxID=672921 RepID=UPI003DA30F35
MFWSRSTSVFIYTVISVVNIFCCGGCGDNNLKGRESVASSVTLARRPNHSAVDDDITDSSSAAASSSFWRENRSGKFAVEALHRIKRQMKRRRKMAAIDNIVGRERDRQSRLMQIRAAFLQQLGLARAPSINRRSLQQIPAEEKQRFLQLYNLTTAESEADDRARSREIDSRSDHSHSAKRLLVYMASCDDRDKANEAVWSDKSMYLMYFDVPADKTIYKTVTSASLRLYKSNQSDCGCQGNQRSRRYANDIFISVYKYNRPIKRKRRARRRQREKVRQITTKRDYEGWIVIDLKSVVKDWIRFPKRNHGLEIRIQDGHDNGINPHRYFKQINCTSEKRPINTDVGSNVTSDVNMAMIPHLEVFTAAAQSTVTERQQRSKRGVSSRLKRRPCVLRPIYITFSDLEWDDWIVAPAGFQTGFCTGSCPKIGWKLDDSPHNYNTIQQYSSCCSPHRMQSLPVLLYNNSVLSVFVLENFIVSDCSCREE